MNTARPLLLERPGFFAWQGEGEGRRGRRNRPARRRQKKRDAGREWRAAAARRHRTKKTHNGRPDAGAGEGLLSAACLPANEEAVGRPPPGRGAREPRPSLGEEALRRLPATARKCTWPPRSPLGERDIRQPRPPPGRSAFSGFSKKNLNFFQKTVDKPLCRW